jgi:hypothetical protein
MGLGKQYRHIVKAKFGPGGRLCPCCQPSLPDKRNLRRHARRTYRLPLDD